MLYDALVDSAALDLAPRAQRVFVGKRAGRPAIRQETINRLMIHAAGRGRRSRAVEGRRPVRVRTGRGGGARALECGRALRNRPWDSARRLPPRSLRGIPVTHRGVATAFVVVSGHAEVAYRPVLESLAPGSATVVVLMGLGRMQSIAQLLIDRGWLRSTPVAILLAASTTESDTWTCTLGELARGFDLSPSMRPARSSSATS